MGRKKFSQREIDIISKLLRRKMAGTRFQQKMVRHTLRTTFEFNIADFNTQGKAFGPEDLEECVRKGRIQILDEATIEAMKQRHAEKRLRDEALRQADAVADGEIVDWQEVQKQWDEYYAQHPEEAENK
jgi:2-oxoglutarate dehydrogenase complex dehydrogenase (E1) component-like enzyme